MTNAIGRPRAVMTDAERLVKFDADLQRKKETAKNRYKNVTIDIPTVVLLDKIIEQMSELLGIKLTKSQAIAYMIKQHQDRNLSKDD